jgi:hypothetical protein
MCCREVMEDSVQDLSLVCICITDDQAQRNLRLQTSLVYRRTPAVLLMHRAALIVSRNCVYSSDCLLPRLTYMLGATYGR